MKVMYIAPRFHTNQADVVKGWIDGGNEVIFISYYTSIIEDYSVLEPIVLGFSPIYNIFDKFYVEILHKNDIYAGNFRIKHGFPPLLKLRKLIREWKPDVMILRERTLYTIVGYHLGKKESKCILYNQSPMWDNPPQKDIFHKLVYRLTPQYRITPVMGRKDEGKIISENSYFLPFVIEPQVGPHDRVYFRDDRINILCIGVFEARKNHIMLLEAMNEVFKEVPDTFHITVIGEATTKFQQDFLQKVKEYVKKNKYEGMVTILTNVPKRNMKEYFTEADVFVLPSTGEPASISQLEAMSYSVPVICSDSNGSACYVINDENGYQFKDKDKEDLKRKLILLLESREKIVRMGEKAYQSIKENNSFSNYFNGVCEILKNYDK